MPTISGGEKLRQRLDNLARKVKKAATVRVGFLEGSGYPNGTSVPMVAAIQEFGAPKAGIPPRPYFRTMVKAKSPEWPEAIAGLLQKTNYDAVATLASMGEGIAGQLRQSIVDTFEPPLSPITLMLRKMRAEKPDLIVTRRTVGEAARRIKAGEAPDGVSTKPLIDTGHLLQTIDYEVKS